MKKSTGWAGLLAGSDSALELVSRYRFKGRRIVVSPRVQPGQVLEFWNRGC
jgi:hypothetical protein